MCIAIAKRAGVVLTDDCLRNSFESNRDGCGVAWIDHDGTLQIYKSLSFQEFLPNYRRIEEAHPESDMLIHFRIKTHGKVDLDNCHPFVINDDMVMMHNGTISNVPTDVSKSDTRMFVEHYLRHLKDGWEECPEVRKSIEQMIGWSKVVVLHRSKGLIIYNESKGSWVDDVWYSNESYKRSAYTGYTGYGGNSYCGGSGKKKEEKKAGEERPKSWEVNITGAVIRGSEPEKELASNLLEYKPKEKQEKEKEKEAIKISYLKEERITHKGVVKKEVSRFDMSGNFLYSTLEDIETPVSVLDKSDSEQAIIDEKVLESLYDSCTVDNGDTAEVHRKCTGCDKYQVDTRLIADPQADTIKDYYCIECLENIYAPSDLVVWEGIEMTMYEYLIDCQEFTDLEIIAYLMRYDSILEEADDVTLNHEREYIARKLA